MLILATDYDAAAGAAGLLLSLWWLFCIAYAVIAFFIPFYIYRIMRRQTANNELLRLILQELQGQTKSQTQLPQSSKSQTQLPQLCKSQTQPPQSSQGSWYLDQLKGT